MGTTIREKKFWEFVANRSQSRIEQAGFYNSFNQRPFTEGEMKEYVEDVLFKLKPYLDGTATVFEIGCASGLTTFSIAPLVKKYIGCDMSEITLKKDIKYAEENDISNVSFVCCQANEIDKYINEKIDIFILNSVCQYFPNETYFKSVFLQMIENMDSGIIYFGDIMDAEKKDDLEKELWDYKEKHQCSKVKTEFKDEMFFQRTFFENLIDENRIKKVSITDKIGKIDNELKKYRFDVIVEIGD